MIVQVWGLPREEYFIQSVFSKLHRQVLTDEKIRRYIFRRTNLSHGNQPVPLPLDFPQGCPSNSTSHRRLAQPLGAGPGSDSRPALPAALCRRRAASTSLVSAREILGQQGFHMEFSLSCFKSVPKTACAGSKLYEHQILYN